MLPVAIVLLLLVLVFIVGAVISNTEPTTLTLFIAQIPATTGGLFVTGLITSLILAGAIVLLGLGIRHQRHRRADLKSLRRSATATVGGTATASRPGKGSTAAEPPADPPPPRRNKTLLDL